MSWLSQNWAWMIIAIAIALFFFRGALRQHAGHGGVGGFGDDFGGGHLGHHAQPEDRLVANAPEAAVDPVGGQAVRTAEALTSIYQGKIYYFASRENRERFEAAPQEYAHKVVGHPVGATQAPYERAHRGGGCC